MRDVTHTIVYFLLSLSLSLSPPLYINRHDGNILFKREIERETNGKTHDSIMIGDGKDPFLVP